MARFQGARLPRLWKEPSLRHGRLGSLGVPPSQRALLLLKSHGPQIVLMIWGRVAAFWSPHHSPSVTL